MSDFDDFNQLYNNSIEILIEISKKIETQSKPYILQNEIITISNIENTINELIYKIQEEEK